jgi:hypothetical protein
MTRYFVRQTMGRYIAIYTLYNEDNCFVLNCVSSSSIPGLLLFSALSSVQSKMLEDIPMMPHYRGSMCQCGDGHDFTLRNSQNCELAFIRYFISQCLLVLYFCKRIKPCILPMSPLCIHVVLPEDDLDISSLPTEASQLETMLLLQESHSIDSLCQTPDNFSYQSVVTDEEEGRACLQLHSEAPVYNSEFMTYMLNFSGRARVPSRENFIMSGCERCFEGEGTYAGSSSSWYQNPQKRVAMVHYQVLHHNTKHYYNTLQLIPL